QSQQLLLYPLSIRMAVKRWHFNPDEILLHCLLCPLRNEVKNPAYWVIPDAAWQQLQEVARIRHSG
ncbi:TPA: hypothetical protein ACXGBC_001716, partial [Klebsiella pneumoniae]